MTIGPISGDTQTQNALTALGTNVLGQDEVQLLQQLVILLANLA
jgi:hypothetical protein